MSDESPPTAASVLGRTCRELRGNYKTETVARLVTNAGLTWSTGRIAHLEQGKVSPTLPTLFALARAFSALLGRPMALADLFAGDGLVAISDDAAVPLAEFRAALTGQPVKPPDGGVSQRVDAWNSAFRRAVAAGWMESDERAIAKLGLSRSRAMTEMEQLWGQPLSAERDKRAGEDANAQRRGRVSRELIAELQEAIADGDDN